MEIVRTKKGVTSLVASRQFLPTDGKYIMFITISPNPKAMIPILKESKTVKGRDKYIKKKYEDCRQIDQYKYCLEYIRSVYLRYSGQCNIVGSAELNKSGNIHIHMLMMDTYVTNRKILEVFRRDIKINPETQMHIKHVKHGNDYMNNIVELTKPIEEVCEYMSKDHELTGELFPNFYTREIDHIEESELPQGAIRLCLA